MARLTPPPFSSRDDWDPPISLGTNQTRALALLMVRGACSRAEISAHLNRQEKQVSDILAILIKAKLVRRHGDVARLATYYADPAAIATNFSRSTHIALRAQKAYAAAPVGGKN